VLAAGEFEFGMHALQVPVLFAPTIEEYVPDEQLVHVLAFITSENLPDTHDWHMSHPVTTTSTRPNLPIHSRL